MKKFSLNELKKKKGFFKYREKDNFIFVSFGRGDIYYLSDSGIEPIDYELWRDSEFFKIKREINVAF